MTRQPSRLAAIANSRPSSPDPRSINEAVNIALADSPPADARLDQPARRGLPMRSLLLLASAALAMAAAPPPKLLTPGEVVAAAPASAWKTIAPDDLLIMDLANGRRVVIQLAPAF